MEAAQADRWRTQALSAVESDCRLSAREGGINECEALALMG